MFLNKGCCGLGMLDEIPIIRKGSVTIEEPSKLLCYTDGLTDLIHEKKFLQAQKKLKRK
jgi:hypothetical protein